MNLPTLATLVLAVHWSIIVGLSVRVIMRRPPVGVSLAWLVVIFSVPFAGASVYLLFGEKRLGGRRAARIAASVSGVSVWQQTLMAPDTASALPGIDPLDEPLVNQAQKARGFPPQAGNHLELLIDTDVVFDRLVADIDAAEVSIDMVFYIWHDGGRVGEVVDALIRAAGRGVRCRALADALGSKRFLRGRSADRLRAAGIECAAALPTGAIRMLFARTDLRNHRKIVVIDSVIAWFGSQNLVDPRYFKTGSGVGEWIDAMVRITGPAAASLDGVFGLDWSIEHDTDFRAPDRIPGPAVGPALSTVQVVPSGPDLKPEAIHRILLTAIYTARRELVISTPYLVPDEAILTALLSAALRGVEVTLIVPARNDSFLVRHASVAHYDDLLAAGVRIAQFNGGLLHTKSLTIDGEIAMVGSVNLDMRSLWLNFEISVIVYDTGFTGQVRALQQSYENDSEYVELDAWRRRPITSRFVANACRLAGPLL